MSDVKARQTSDAKQGGEGTNSLHNKGYEADLKDISKVENTQDGGKPLDDHTR